MDSELTNIAAVKALNQGVATTDSPSFAGLTATGSVSLAGASTTADITFGDNDKAVFGAGSDLQIYHDGSNSYVKDSGTGNLRLQGATLVQITDPAFTSYSAQFDPTGAATLYHNGSAKLATTSTGIDVTGTVTADGLTVDGSGTIATFLRDAGANGSLTLTFPSQKTTLTSLSGFKVNANSVDRFDIATNGDISFYEDTGTTPKFFWDASAEALGIGTTSPAAEIEISNTGSPQLRVTDTTNTVTSKVMSDTSFGYVGTQTNHNFNILVNNQIKTTFDTSGNVGIGTTSPSFKLDVAGNARAAYFALRSNETAPAESSFIYRPDTGVLAFGTGTVERARLDASGNLLVGKSVTTFNTEGFLYETGKAVEVTTDSDRVMRLNRTTNDGNILEFNKGGTTVGSIGVVTSDNLYIQGNSTHVGLAFGSSALTPFKNGAYTDGVSDIGGSSNRFKDLYLSGTANAGGLTVAASGANGIELDPDAAATTDSGRLFFSTSAGTNAIFGSSGNLRFTTGATAGASSGTERMRIDSSGNLGIGNSAPEAKVHVEGEVVIENGSGTRKATARVVPAGTTTTCIIDLRSQTSWRPAMLKVFAATVATASGNPGAAYRVMGLRHVTSANTVAMGTNDILTDPDCVISTSYGAGTVTVTVTVPSGQQVVWEVECTSYVAPPTFTFA